MGNPLPLDMNPYPQFPAHSLTGASSYATTLLECSQISAFGLLRPLYIMSDVLKCIHLLYQIGWESVLVKRSLDYKFVSLQTSYVEILTPWCSAR